MKRFLLLALLLLPVFAFADERKEKVGKVELSDELKTLLKLLNASRAKEKLAPLSIDPLLCRVAKSHTENMAKQEKMAHELDGKRVADRVTAVGYDYRFVAENLAIAEGTLKDPPPEPADIHKEWMESKGHRTNMLNERYTQVGLAVVRSKKGNYYYTQVFAAPRR